MLLFKVYVNLLVNFDISFNIRNVRIRCMLRAVGPLFLWAGFVFRFVTIINLKNIAKWFEATEK
jgi:hypothetical protein